MKFRSFGTNLFMFYTLLLGGLLNKIMYMPEKVAKNMYLKLNVNFVLRNLVYYCLGRNLFHSPQINYPFYGYKRFQFFK